MENSTSPGPFKRDLADEIQAPGAPPGRSEIRRWPLTAAIVAVNVVVCALMALVTAGQSLSAAPESIMKAWGSNFGRLTLEGQYYRLVTNLFLHWDILHIGFNMWVLWDVGRAVESLYGKSKFLVIYLLAGIAGSLASLLIHPQGDSAGASGAVFGAFGALLVFLKRHEKNFDKSAVKAATRSVVVLLFFNLAFGLSHPFIDNAAHIGGFLGGIVAGVAVCPSAVEQKGWRTRDIIAALIIVYVLYRFLRFDVGLYT